MYDHLTAVYRKRLIAIITEWHNWIEFYGYLTNCNYILHNSLSSVFFYYQQLKQQRLVSHLKHIFVKLMLKLKFLLHTVKSAIHDVISTTGIAPQWSRYFQIQDLSIHTITETLWPIDMRKWTITRAQKHMPVTYHHSNISVFIRVNLFLNRESYTCYWGCQLFKAVWASFNLGDPQWGKSYMSILWQLTCAIGCLLNRFGRMIRIKQTISYLNK